MTVAVASGTVSTNGQTRNIAAASVTIAAADATNPRFDLVVAASSGTLAARTGMPAAAPVFPTPTAGDVLLASVYVPAGATSITSAQLVDKRVLLPPASAAPGFGLTPYRVKQTGLHAA